MAASQRRTPSILPSNLLALLTQGHKIRVVSAQIEFLGGTTKIHAAVDALGNPVRLLLTAGQASEYGQANALIEGFGADHVVADKGCDSDEFIETIELSGATAVIPPRRNRKNMRPYDKHIYKERNLVERFFQKIKNFHRIATRYERLARNYLSMLQLVATVIWLK